jgi:uncharacterized protein (DUF1800 family)
MSWLRRTWARETGQTALSGLLCGLMVVPQAAFAAGGHLPKRPERRARLTQQERVLHVLNRFAFGPRPGEVEAVEKMGLERWFQQQLQPQTIDDSAFEERMNEFPAMRLSQDRLMQEFPSQAMIRMSERRDLPLPSDRVTKAIMADARFEYDERQKAQALVGVAGTQQTLPVPTSSSRMGRPSASPQNDMQASMAMAGGGSMEPPVRMGHRDSAAPQNNDDMQASMEMAGGGASMNSQGSQQTLMSDGERATDAVELNKKGKPKVKDLSQPMDRDDVLSVLAMPPDQRVERLEEMKPDEMMDFKAALRPVQKLLLVKDMTPEQEEIAGSFITAPERVIGAEVLESRLERDVFSERQLQAVMTDFWLNHFSVYLRKNENEPYYLPAYERDVILPNALGKFENLLVAVAQSPAMLMYLDNWESVGPHSVQAERAEEANFRRPNAKKQSPKGINENYGRELMELHTLGVNGGYTQQDVIEVAKCFTGWTIDKPALGGQAYFDENKHEPGTKIVLGHKIKENGQKEGLEVLHILATSPATAHFISQKLAVRFVSDDPPSALVNRMAATFLKTDGNIKAVLSTMYHSPEFWSPQVYRAKVKTPVEFMASALRASGASVSNPLALVQAMDRLGMPIYGMQTPQGYSWMSDDWVSSNALISRMNFALVLSSNREPGTRTDWPVLLGDGDAAPVIPDVATENKLEIALLGQPASDRTRSVVLAQFGDPTVQQSAEEGFKARPAAQTEDMMTGGSGRFMQTRAGKDRQAKTPGTPLDTMAGLLLGSPEFQRR